MLFDLFLKTIVKISEPFTYGGGSFPKSTEEVKCTGIAIAYNAQGISIDTVFICTLCGKSNDKEGPCKHSQEPNT
jgi:hypothetical protein